MKKLLGVLGVILAVSGPVQAADDMRATVQVQGHGSVSAVPDIATIRLGVREEAKEASVASRAVAKALAAILKDLEAAGIASKDVQTTQLRLSPMMDYSSSKKLRKIGFEATSTLSVTVRDLDGLGQVLDQVMQAGANHFDGLSFDLSNRQAVEDEARKAAVADAIRKATLLTEAAGQVLGNVVQIQEGGRGAEPQFAMGRMAMERSSDMPIAPGELEVTAQVSMQFELQSEY